MAKKNKEVKPFPTVVAILILLLALVAMGCFVYYIISPPGDEPHVDSLGEQSFAEESSVEPPPPVVEVKEYMSEANVGDAVVFGKYEQDGNSDNGAEAIEWMVLDKNDTGLFLISRYCLDCKPYNESRANVNWQDCSLRAWLNGEFYNTAFDETEKSNIIGRGEFVSEDPLVDSSVDFVDNVSILSSKSVKSYYEYDSWRIIAPTEYAVKQGAYTEDGNTWWWLRESGADMLSKDTMAEYVYFNGAVMNQGFSVDYDKVAVRPVIWVSLDAEKGDMDDTQPESSEIVDSSAESEEQQEETSAE